MMRADLFNPFIVAAGEVLAREAGVQVTRGALTLQRETHVTDDVTVIIGLVGDVSGMVFYGMSLATAMGVVSHILGEEMNDFDKLAQSGVAELGNVIAGQACIGLSELGLDVKLSVPTLLIGKGSRISTLDIERLIVPLETELGTLRIDLALRESRSNSRQRADGPVQMVAHPA
ncbi:MAG: chemotaxis protein CheX [Anaerolineae bacterium]